MFQRLPSPEPERDMETEKRPLVVASRVPGKRVTLDTLYQTCYRTIFTSPTLPQQIGEYSLHLDAGDAEQFLRDIIERAITFHLGQCQTPDILQCCVEKPTLFFTRMPKEIDLLIFDYETSRHFGQESTVSLTPEKMVRKSIFEYLYTHLRRDWEIYYAFILGIDLISSDLLR